MAGPQISSHPTPLVGSPSSSVAAGGRAQGKAHVQVRRGSAPRGCWCGCPCGRTSAQGTGCAPTPGWWGPPAARTSASGSPPPAACAAPGSPGPRPRGRPSPPAGSRAAAPAALRGGSAAPTGSPWTAPWTSPARGPPSGSSACAAPRLRPPSRPSSADRAEHSGVSWQSEDWDCAEQSWCEWSLSTRTGGCEMEAWFGRD
eukprot:3491566-Pyramimonas_sp.AAC.1